MVLNAIPLPFGSSKKANDTNVWSVEYRRNAITAKALEKKCLGLRSKILALREKKNAPSREPFQIVLTQRQYIRRIERLSSYCLSIKKILCGMGENNSDGRQKLHKANNTCKRLIEGYEREFDALIQSQCKEESRLSVENRKLMQSIFSRLDSTC
jgi:hypothetical protein